MTTTPEPRPLEPRPAPAAGQARLRRRLADRHDFRDALLAGVAQAPEPGTAPGTTTLGARLDVAGDPTLVTVAELWSRVADTVAAYTELTAGERYLTTAQDWTDLRRTTDLVGHRPTQRAAARGWIRCLTDRGASPVVPAGTRVQAPGTPERPAQTFEVTVDTPLRADWAELTVTAVPAPEPPPGSALRLLSDPGFRAGDQVLLVAERPAAYVTMPTSWSEWLGWVSIVHSGATASRAVQGTVTVTRTEDDLGAVLVTTDRALGPMLAPVTGTTYAAYRVRTRLTLAHRVQELSYVDTAGAAQTAAVSYGSEPSAVSAGSLLVSDATAASPGMGLVVWNGSEAHVTTVEEVGSLAWSVAPGTKRTVGRVTLSQNLPTSLRNANIEVALVDERVVAQHHELPPLPAGAVRLRVHPRPEAEPALLAVRTTAGWEMAPCSRDAHDTPSDVGGMLLVLARPFTGAAVAAAATANLVPVQHGTTTTSTLTLQGATTIVPGPVAGDVDTSGRVTDSLTVRVGGVAFDEVPSLYGRGPSDLVFSTRLAADGRMVLTFGDGTTGAAPRGEVTARWRIGGGLDGELDAPLIDTLLGSVRGVRKVAGVGRTTGAADQEDALRLRGAAAARVRALDRAVSATDLADLALTVPGTSHSTAWRGPGPSGCPCGGTGLHVASLRLTSTGVREPLEAELTTLASYLDARRDTTVPLCVCAAVASPLTVTLSVATDDRREPAAVREAVRRALTDPAGPLSPRPRRPGVPLDASDVTVVVHRVPGVVGVVSLSLGAGLRPSSAGDLALGRVPAERYELLSVGAVTVVSP